MLNKQGMYILGYVIFLYLVCTWMRFYYVYIPLLYTVLFLDPSSDTFAANTETGVFQCVTKKRCTHRPLSGLRVTTCAPYIRVPSMALVYRWKMKKDTGARRVGVGSRVGVSHVYSIPCISE